LQILKTNDMINYLHHLGFDAYIQISITACLDAKDVNWFPYWPDYMV